VLLPGVPLPNCGLL